MLSDQLSKEQLETQLNIANGVIEKQTATIRELMTEIVDLKSKNPKIHNERNAGRKQLATVEQKRLIMELHEKGYSLFQIVMELNVPWNKGTIKNIIDREKIKNSANS